MATAHGILNWLFKLDSRATVNLSNGLKNKPLTKFLMVFTELGSSLGAAVIFSVLFIASGAGIFKLIFIYLIQLAIVETIKYFVKRPRPKASFKHLKETNIFGLPTTSGSFPSGHASNIATMAVLFVNYYDTPFPLTQVIFLLALAIAISRIYLRKHFLLDVLGGMVIGYTITWLMLPLLG